MSEQQCKAAACAGGCLDAIVVDNFRELTDVAVTLVANGLLTDEQLSDIIELYTRFENEVERRTEADMKARERLKEILNL